MCIHTAILLLMKKVILFQDLWLSALWTAGFQELKRLCLLLVSVMNVQTSMLEHLFYSVVGFLKIYSNHLPNFSRVLPLSNGPSSACICYDFDPWTDWNVALSVRNLITHATADVLYYLSLLVHTFPLMNFCPDS